MEQSTHCSIDDIRIVSSENQIDNVPPVRTDEISKRRARTATST